MASTKSLQNSIDWALPFMGRRPMTLSNNEPAITNANIIQQTVLSAPFAWRWNRKVTTITTVIGQQDYVAALPDFGYMEKASVSTASKTMEIFVKTSLSAENTQGRPENIAAQMDDNAGNITFRLMKVPDAVYTVTVIYQKKAPLIANLADTWAMPDEFQYIYNRGFLSLYYLHADDPKVQVENSKFVASLLGAAEGLDETARNIFLNNWFALRGQDQARPNETAQGIQARGV